MQIVNLLFDEGGVDKGGDDGDNPTQRPRDSQVHKVQSLSPQIEHGNYPERHQGEMLHGGAHSCQSYSVREELGEVVQKSTRVEHVGFSGLSFWWLGFLSEVLGIRLFRSTYDQSVNRLKN